MRLDKFNGPQRATLALFHPNAKGTGCAVKMSVVPATCFTEGGLAVSLVKQEDGFIWNNSLDVFLQFDDVSKVLQVLRGETESIDEGKGLYEKSGELSLLLTFRHCLEPVSGYRLDVCQSLEGKKSNATMFFSPSEAIGLSIALENSMSAIAFGLWRW